MRRPVVRGLVEAICRNCERLKLWGEIGREPAYLVELTAFGTTLAMNFLTRGTFTGRQEAARRAWTSAKVKVKRVESRESKASYDVMAGKLRIVVLYDRWEPEEDSLGLERQGAARAHARQEGSRGRSRRGADQARPRAGASPARRLAEEPARARQARLRPHLQPQRVVRRATTPPTTTSRPTSSSSASASPAPAATG